MLPLLPAEFRSGDVGRVLRALGRGWSELTAVIVRLEDAGAIELIRTEGRQKVRVWQKAKKRQTNGKRR